MILPLEGRISPHWGETGGEAARGGPATAARIRGAAATGSR
jgi:hypothetical protein